MQNTLRRRTACRRYWSARSAPRRGGFVQRSSCCSDIWPSILGDAAGLSQVQRCRPSCLASVAMAHSSRPCHHLRCGACLFTAIFISRKNSQRRMKCGHRVDILASCCVPHSRDYCCVFWLSFQIPRVTTLPLSPHCSTKIFCLHWYSHKQRIIIKISTRVWFGLYYSIRVRSQFQLDYSALTRLWKNTICTPLLQL